MVPKIFLMGIGGLAQSPIPNPQSPIPNPHMTYKQFNIIIKKSLFKNFIYLNILHTIKHIKKHKLELII